MPLNTLALILLSVCLSAGSQVLLKMGMSSPAIQASLNANALSVTSILTIAGSPLVLTGFTLFGFSALSWLWVLARIDVSRAYPFVALGTVLTVLAGVLILGETMTSLRIFGVVVVVAGVILVGLS